MNWQNGRKLTDPKELAKIQDWYFEPRFMSEESNEELMEQKMQRERLKTNQAR